MLLKVNKIKLSWSMRGKQFLCFFFSTPALIPSSTCFDPNQARHSLMKGFIVWPPSATFLLPLFSLPGTMKLFANPWTSVFFTSSCLCPPSFFWLQYQEGSSRQSLSLSWPGSSTSPGGLPFSSSLQGNVAHSFFWVNLIACTYLFYNLYDTTFIHISISLKNNKLWLWVRHCDKCREHPVVREIQVSLAS